MSTGKSSGHTKGPWIAYPADKFLIGVRQLKNNINPVPICVLPKGPDNVLDNAALIAAAPDLLEAAKYALLVSELGNCMDLDGDELLRKAIAKATGQEGEK